MKNRPKKQASDWRITWFQVVEGKRLFKWFTGSQQECEVLARACQAANEQYNLCAPGTFK